MKNHMSLLLSVKSGNSRLQTLPLSTQNFPPSTDPQQLWFLFSQSNFLQIFLEKFTTDNFPIFFNFPTQAYPPWLCMQSTSLFALELLELSVA